MRRASSSDVPLVNPTEYLEYLAADGWKEEDFPVVHPVRQKRIWERFRAGERPEKLAQVIEQLHREDYHFHVEGGSWTNDISWIYGYENVLGPMEKASALFYEKVLRAGVSPGEHRYRNALLHLLTQLQNRPQPIHELRRQPGQPLVRRRDRPVKMSAG